MSITNDKTVQFEHYTAIHNAEVIKFHFELLTIIHYQSDYINYKESNEKN